MGESVVTRFTGLPKQKLFVRSDAREVLYSGAYRAGKSLSLCLKAVKRASHPLAREALVRKELVTLKATTLRTLLQGDGQTPPVLAPGSYVHNKSDKTIRIVGGGEIVYFGLDDPGKIGSYSLTGVGGDEVTEFTEDDWFALKGRTSVYLPELPNQLYGACNPQGPSHFLAVRFGLAAGHTPAPGTEAIVTCMQDNAANLPPDYIADALTWTGIRKARYVDGLWVASDGLVYPQWNRLVHVRTVEAPPARVVVAVDDGFTNPFSCLRGEVDPDGRAHIAREHYQPGMLEAEKVAKVREMCTGAEIVWVDPAAAGLKGALRAAGLPVQDADNDVLRGIGKVQQRLAPAADGRPRLTVAPECTALQREIEGYEWNNKSTKDVPVKENDHAMDALRYLCAGLDRGSVVTIRVGDGTPPPGPAGEAPRRRRDVLSAFDDDSFR